MFGDTTVDFGQLREERQRFSPLLQLDRKVVVLELMLPLLVHQFDHSECRLAMLQ